MSSDRRETVPAAHHMNRVSVVDDDESVLDAATKVLRSAGFRVATFASAELFLNSGAIRETECLILDVRMPGMGGLELQRVLRGSGTGVPIIFLTALHSTEIQQRAIKDGAVDCLSKPFEASVLMAAVETACRFGAVRVLLQRLRCRMAELEQLSEELERASKSGASLDRDSDAFLDDIVRAAARMSESLSGLMSYARATAFPSTGSD